MHRLFHGDLPTQDAWVHLMQNEELNEPRLMSLIDAHIKGDMLLLFVNSQNCLCCSKVEAFGHVKNLLSQGVVKIADPAFNGRVLVHPLGVGVGHAK